jgi:hypothetical protein
MATYEAVSADLARVDAELERWTDAEHDVLSVLSGRATDRRGVPGYNCFTDPDVVAQLQRFADNPDVRIGPPHDLGVLVSVDSMAASFGRALDMHAAITDNAPGLRSGPSIGPIPQLYAKPRLIDLLPSAPAPSPDKTYTYAAESGTYDTAVETAEGEISPEAGVTLTDVTVRYSTIRHFIKATREQLSDVVGLQDRLGARLVAGIYNRIESQCIAGNGTGENLRGFLATSGVAAVSGAPLDSLRDAVAAVEASGAGPVNFIALSVSDSARIDKLKATGSQEYLGEVFGGAAGTLWNVPRVTVARMPANTALVGATVVDGVPACRVIIREPVGVLVSDSDQDDFVRNRATIHATTRVTLEVVYPAAFCRVTLQ